ncbi:MAG: hypothetical protein E7218_05105 [Anaerofustis stercorihominis]|nr:hypothetical protein [Anaerofustis stercorihominis]
MRKINVPARNTVYSVRYSSFRGADFTHSPAETSVQRSNDCLNVYKDYSDSADTIRTRKGLRKIFSNECELFDPGDMHAMIYFDGKVYLHFGAYLLEYTDFPSEVSFTTPENDKLAGIKIIGTAMKNSDSQWFVFRDNLYLIDGRSYRYLTKDGFFGDVAAQGAYIPTTRINVDPGGGNGVVYQEENLLTPYRKNSFLSDGVSKEYKLDAENIVSGSVTVLVNGVSVNKSYFTEDCEKGSVIFDNAPAVGATPGQDNVIIQFAVPEDNADMIKKCTVVKVFDNRVFLTGNEDYPGVIFHSEFEDATYFAKNSYYDDGEDGCPIRALLTASNALVAIKDNDTNGPKVFIHVPSIDYELGKVYPITNTPIYLGASGPGMNFNDELLYLSPSGLESLRITSSAISVSHRSDFIDGKLLSYSKEAMQSAKMISWKGYLMILIDGDIFLADSECMSKVGGDIQYEWFYWKFALNEPVKNIYDLNGELYFACADGNLYVFDGYTDGGNAFESYWVIPEDHLGSEVMLKSINKKGCFLRCRSMEGGAVRVMIDTDKKRIKDVGIFGIGNFSFVEGKTDFSRFSFFTSRDCYINIKPDAKRFRSINFRISGDGEHPFSLGEIKAEFILREYD